MDKMEKAEIKILVKTTIRETLEGAEERWVEKEELMKQFQMLNANWMKNYADRLPRQRVEYIDKQGKPAKTHWAYPVHKINRMIEDGTIKNL